MNCPKCAYEFSSVVYTRHHPDGKNTLRRRECVKCGQRYTTSEQPFFRLPGRPKMERPIK